MRSRVTSLAVAAFLIASVTAPASAATGAAPCGGRSLAVFVASSQDDTLTAFHPGCSTIGSPTSVGVTPILVAITPDGRTAYTLDFDSSDLTPVHTATGHAGAPIPFGRNSFAQALAITPDGHTAYVGISSGDRDSHSLVGITLATGHSAAPIALGPGSPIGIAITPDGTRAYVSVENNAGTHSWVLPVDLAARTVGARIPIAGAVGYVAITPDGRTVYAAGDQLVPISTATNLAGTPIAVAGSHLAITPDGSRVFVADAFSNTVSSVSVTTGHVLRRATIGNFPDGLAVTPDGATLYVANGGDGTLSAVTIATGHVAPTAMIADDAAALAITPDQAPVARFFARHPLTHGQPVTLDASNSSGVSSRVVSYHWRFGDGSQATTAAPTVDHTFATAGSYAVTLTVTDAAGTSTTQVFTGQTVSRNGGPGAQIQHTLTVS
jgi:YVTN family beta-propeller protein